MRIFPMVVPAVVLLVLCVADPADAIFMPPQATPVDRLVKNITAFAKENPKDANAHYLLGRVHALALRHNRGVVGTYPNRKRGNDGEGLPRVASDYLQKWVGRGHNQAGEKKPQGLSDEQKARHLAASLKAYARALELNDKPAHYHNGLAFVLDFGRDLADRVPPPDVSQGAGEPTYAQAKAAFGKLQNAEGEAREALKKTLREYWRRAAIEKYLDAYKRSVEKDARIENKPLEGLDSLVSFEAGQAYKRLAAEGETTEQQKEQIEAIEKHLAALKNKPRGPVTPIVFHIEHPKPLAHLLDSKRIVRFDLDGDGHAERRPWVRPDTAILCWDPDRTGRITSGKQLFGSVTFHLYPGDGYTAMNLLDDDRDGKLAGSELRGLAIWFDRNTNGRSDDGEVVPIEKTPVKSLSVRALSSEEAAPANPAGLVLQDGRALPTYDWIAGSIDE
ncbi:MAG: hypothetical protein R3236_03190 [Phycisphaeraceae bacterium]|nr:hypothetical protein [Phycisphaeraceae bacterium]